MSIKGRLSGFCLGCFLVTVALWCVFVSVSVVEELDEVSMSELWSDVGFSVVLDDAVVFALVLVFFLGLVGVIPGLAVSLSFFLTFFLAFLIVSNERVAEMGWGRKRNQMYLKGRRKRGKNVFFLIGFAKEKRNFLWSRDHRKGIFYGSGIT